ncbi:MAG TPA: hypothetical protein VE733_00910 [Streptosporangiaceae bacterium]|jgi:hypothetical protein|nr:hypothetical protein [Streptosporangiaceae bacterium]
MIDGADVVVHGYRPGALAAFGLQSDAGPVTVVTPPGTPGNRTLAWPPRLATYSQDPPAW